MECDNCEEQGVHKNKKHKTKNTKKVLIEIMNSTKKFEEKKEKNQNKKIVSEKLKKKMELVDENILQIDKTINIFLSLKLQFENEKKEIEQLQ